MSNELLFILIAIADLAVMTFVWRIGRRWLELFIILNYIFANLFVQKFSIVFGVETTIAAVFYASMFLGTDIISEHFGKKAAYQLIWKAFFSIAILTVVGQAVLLMGHTEYSAVAAAAMNDLFSAIPRITFAGLFAFLLVQRFDIWIYHFIRQKTQGAHLWLRNIVSTVTAQFLDTILFFGLAFYGVLPIEVIIQLMVISYIVKLIIAFIDTPFIYLSYWIKGKRLVDSKGFSV